MSRHLGRSIALATVLALPLAVPAKAQVAENRSFQICMNIGLGTCASMNVTTLADFLGETRVGTTVVVDIRNLQGWYADDHAFASGLENFSFYGHSMSSQPVESSFTSGIGSLTSLGGAPVPAPPLLWGGEASSYGGNRGSGLPTSFGVGAGGTGGIAPTQESPVDMTEWIGGCAVVPGGMPDLYAAVFLGWTPFYQPSLMTCGADQAYRFAFSTPALVDAWGIDLVRFSWQGMSSATSGFVGNYCYVGTDGTSRGSPNNRTQPSSETQGICDLWIDGARISPPSSPTPDLNVVPEPVTMVLLATGLLGIGVAARRRRKEHNEEVTE